MTQMLTGNMTRLVTAGEKECFKVGFCSECFKVFPFFFPQVFIPKKLYRKQAQLSQRSVLRASSRGFLDYMFVLHTLTGR